MMIIDTCRWCSIGNYLFKSIFRLNGFEPRVAIALWYWWSYILDSLWFRIQEITKILNQIFLRFDGSDTFILSKYSKEHYASFSSLWGFRAWLWYFGNAEFSLLASFSSSVQSARKTQNVQIEILFFREIYFILTSQWRNASQTIIQLKCFSDEDLIYAGMFEPKTC